MVEERHPCLDAGPHQHVVDPLHRVVGHEEVDVGAQHGVQGGLGTRGGEVRTHRRGTGIEGRQVVGARERAQAGVALVGEVGRHRLEHVAAVGRRGREVVVVAREDLVGALAREHHLVVGGHGPPQQVEGGGVVGALRLGHRRDRVVERRGELSVAHAQPVVIGAVDLRHLIGEDELIARLPAPRLETDAVRGHVGLSELGHEGHEQTGVEPSRQQHADRHVAGQPATDGVAEGVVHAVDPFCARHTGIPLVPDVVRLPVDAVGGRTARVDNAHGRRRELVHPSEQGALAGDDRMPGEVMVHADRIEAGVDTAPGEEGRDRGREPEPPAFAAEVQRLDAETVAGHDDAAP